MPVLPIPNPMDEVRGGKMFWRQLNSRFAYGQIRHLGSYKDSNPPRCPRSANNGNKRIPWTIRPHGPQGGNVDWKQVGLDGTADNLAWGHC